MKTRVGSKICHYVRRAGVFVIAVVLVAGMLSGMVGCTISPRPFAGGSGTPEDPYQISTWYHLHNVRDYYWEEEQEHFILINDLNAFTRGYRALAGPIANGGEGWEPIGSDFSSVFWGVFDGQGYEVRDLFINRPDQNWIGLFGGVFGDIKNLNVVEATVIGGYQVGGLVGASAGELSNCYTTGSVTGQGDVGGLVGHRAPRGYSGGEPIGGKVDFCYSTAAVSGTLGVGGLVGRSNDLVVSNSYSSGDVTGTEDVGGLVGLSDGIISNCYSTGNVTGDGAVGGLVGTLAGWKGTVSNCYATGSVIGNDYVGGLVGANLYGTVDDSYSTGAVTGNYSVAGLVGYVYYGTVNNSYSIGGVTGHEYVGGLVGSIQEGTVSNCYATSNVTGDLHVGGLVGDNEGTVTDCFWDLETSGQTASAGGTGKTTAEMRSIATFSDTATEGLDESWEIVAVAPGETNDAYTWNMVDSVTYPVLSWQPV